MPLCPFAPCPLALRAARSHPSRSAHSLLGTKRGEVPTHCTARGRATGRIRTPSGGYLDLRTAKITLLGDVRKGPHDESEASTCHPPGSELRLPGPPYPRASCTRPSRKCQSLASRGWSGSYCQPPRGERVTDDVSHHAPAGSMRATSAISVLATTTPPSFVRCGREHFGAVGHLSEPAARPALAHLKLAVEDVPVTLCCAMPRPSHPSLGHCLNVVGDLAVTGTGHFA
jgi:hypothetical protein